MTGIDRTTLFLAVSLHALAVPSALGQSRINRERRLRDLETITQEFVELQEGQAVRWTEIEAALRAQQRRIDRLDAEIAMLRRQAAERNSLVTLQQNHIDHLAAKVSDLQAKLMLAKVGSGPLKEIHSRSTALSFAATFRARRPPASPSGRYYHPVIDRSRQTWPAASSSHLSAYELP
jgi:hypothetical protein